MTTSRLTDDLLRALADEVAEYGPSVVQLWPWDYGAALLSEVHERRADEARLPERTRLRLADWRKLTTEEQAAVTKWLAAEARLPAPAAGSPDTRTLGKDEGEPAAADPREGTAAVCRECGDVHDANATGYAAECCWAHARGGTVERHTYCCPRAAPPTPTDPETAP